MDRVLNFENGMGAVASLELPELWLEAAHEPDVGGRQLRRFHVSYLPDVRFCSYNRTVPLSNPGAETFQRTIYSPFHQVELDELFALEEIVEGIADDLAFEVVDAVTGYLNGFRCLRVRGIWLSVNHVSDTVFIDVKGDGSQVQQLYFAAPEQFFSDHREQGEAIFKSIKWRNSSADGSKPQM